MSNWRRMRLKPGDPETGMMLSSDGRIKVFGNVPDPGFDASWDEGSARDIGRDLQVIDWAEPAGYVLSGFGGVRSFGSVTATPTGQLVTPVNGLPWFHGYDWYRCFAMDPAGNGAGYAVLNSGLIYRFGTPLPPSIGTYDANPNLIVDWALDWATKRWYMLHEYGGVVAGNGASGPDGSYNGFHRGLAIWRSIMAVDFATGIMYTMNGYGKILKWHSGNKDPGNKPNWTKQGWDVARDLELVSYTPFQYKILDTAGAVHTVTASDPPSLTLMTPSSGSTITNDRTILISWIYSDPEFDRAEKFEVVVYSPTQYNAAGFVPGASLGAKARFTVDDGNVRSVTTGDLVNGTYRVYVRGTEAVSGLQTGWVMSQFAINVAKTPAPVMTITNLATEYRRRLVSTLTWNSGLTALFPAPHLEIQYLDENANYIGGEDDPVWRQVAATPLTGSTTSKTATIYDDQTPFNVERTYRSRITNNDDGATISGEWTTTPVEANPLFVFDTVLSVPGLVAPYAFQTQKADFSRPAITGEFGPTGSAFPIVVRDGHTVKSRRGQVALYLMDELDLSVFQEMLRADSTWLYRDQFGTYLYFELTGEVRFELLRAAPLPTEVTRIRNANVATLDVIEVERP